MRLGLRRGTPTPPADETGDTGHTGNPGHTGHTTADLAELFEGRWLWVAVPAQAGHLALRRVGDGQVVDVPTQVVTDQPHHLAARFDLAALDGAEARHDVVVVSSDVFAVTTGPRPAGPAGRPGPDGRTQHTLARSPEGLLRVRTSPLVPAASVLAARRLDDAVELTLLDAGAELAILAEDDTTVLASWPIDAHGTVTLTTASIADLSATTRPAVTRRDGEWIAVRRRANDLPDPRAGAPLPQLDHPTEDRPRLRLPWSREALLQIRIFDLDPDPDPATGPTP